MKVPHLCQTLCDPHGLDSPWNSPGKNTGVGSLAFPRGFSQPRDLTQVSCSAGRFFTSWATREALYSQYIMQNARLDEAQAGIKIARRNINSLRYAYDTTLMAESKEELKSLLIRVKEESEKAGLKHSIQKMKMMASGPITLWQIDG